VQETGQGDWLQGGPRERRIKLTRASLSLKNRIIEYVHPRS
jgi:hypothetical protein